MKAQRYTPKSHASGKRLIFAAARLLLSTSIAMAIAGNATAAGGKTVEQASVGQVESSTPQIRNTLNGRFFTSSAQQHNKEKGTISSATDVPADPTNEAAGLGAGYHSIEEKIVSNTGVFVTNQESGFPLGDSNNDGVTDEAEFAGNTETYFFVGIDMAQKTVSDLLSGGASGDVKFSSLNVKGTIEAAIESSSDQYTGSYTLVARVKPRKAVLYPEPVASNGLSADQVTGTGDAQLYPSNDMKLEAGAASTSQALQEIIGDEYVEAVEYGSWLIVSLKFEYLNSQDKKDIGGQIQVDWAGGVNVDGGGSFSNIDRANTVKVSIYAEQFGGNTGRLDNILASNILSCSLNSPTSCFSTFSAAIDYMRDDYPGQFYDGSNNLKFDEFRPVRFFTTRYDTAGPILEGYVADPFDRLTFASRRAFRKAHALWELSQLHERRAIDLENNAYISLSSSDRSAISNIKGLAKDNANALASFITSCLDTNNTSYCANNWPLQNTLKSYDETLLELY